MRIATWNLQNLFSAGTPAGPRTQEAYDAKLDALAAGVRAMAPDVLGVQEVGDDDALADLVARVGGQWHVHAATPDDRGIRVGALSRTPLEVVEEVAAFPVGLLPVQQDDDGATIDRMGRPALHVRVSPYGEAVDVVVCHLKSKLISFPDGRFDTRDEDERARYAAYALFRRAAEATTVRAAATRLLGGQGAERAVVVLGDLNDEPLAATTQILLGPPGSEIGTAGYDTPDRGDAARLWNLGPRIPEEQRYTRVYRGRGELIDHVLVSRALVTRIGDGDVTTTPADAPARLPSVTDDPRLLADVPGSDHRPVLAVVAPRA